MWVFLAIVSAVFLGIYDILKKKSLKNNAVLPVLLLSTSTSALLFIPFMLVSKFNPSLLNGTLFFVPEISWHDHFLIVIKSCIVASSWILAYYAMKYLPVTIVSPIRSTGPMWTLLGAVLIYSEQLNWVQWMGIGVSMIFFYLFTLIGNKEGVSFRKNKWVFFIMAATLIGAASGLYDKFLIRKVNNMAVQAWFSIYMIPVILPFVYTFWYRKLGKTTPFQFRYTIPLIGITLTIADFCYFYALTDEASLIAIVSSLRRTSVLVTFLLGALLFKEKNITRKLLLLIGMLLGVLIIVWGSV